MALHERSGAWRIAFYSYDKMTTRVFGIVVQCEETNSVALYVCLYSTVLTRYGVIGRSSRLT
jgi:hypothetical protein